MGLRLLIAIAILAVSTGLEARAQNVAPNNFNVTILSPTALRLTWQLNSTAETNIFIGYHPGTSGAFGGFPDGSLPPNSVTFDAVGLAPGATYQFLVEAAYPGNLRYPSPIIQVTMPNFAAPANLTALIASPTTINLRWSDTTTNEDGFFIGYRTDTNASFAAFPGGTVLPDTTNFVASGLAPSTTYQFLVEAFVGNTAFADSSPITVTTPGFRPPSNLTAVAANPTALLLRWSDTTTNETGFRIAFRVGTSTNNPFFQFPGGTLPANTTNFLATGLFAGTTYQFFVQAFVGTTAFADSPAVTVSTPNVISNRPFAPAVVGQAFLLNLASTTNTGGTVTFNVSGTLPPGISFDGTNQIAGTPTQIGAFNSIITASYTAGPTLTNPLAIRVIPASGAPLVTAPIPTQLVSTNTPTTIPVGNYFNDPDSEVVVRFVTSVGNFDVALYATIVPQTVSNFLGYVDRGNYSNSIIHRASPNFVVQGGGFTNSGTNFGLIPTQPSPTNEPGIQHARGTIAMAKLGGDPNSATDQWFINLRDNSDQLDDQNGGFTAFGRVLGNGMSVLDAINALPRSNYTINVRTTTNVAPILFEDMPVDDTSAPATLDPAKLILVQSVRRIQPLTFSITGTIDPNFITAGISGSNLTVTAVNHFGGLTSLTVTGTDLDGTNVSTNVAIEIDAPYTTWLKTNALAGSDSLPDADPDGDGFPNAVEFALGGSVNTADASSVRGGFQFVTVTNEQFLAITFLQRKDLGGALVSVDATSDVSSVGWTNIWNSDGGANPPFVVRASQGEFWQTAVLDAVPISSNAPMRFLRLRVNLPP